MRKARIALGHSDRKVAKAKAEEVAAAFRREEPAQGSEATLQVLFDTYGSEVTPEKGESKRKHDVRCAEMFLRYFGAQTLPRTLTRREWDRFVADRRRGASRLERPTSRLSGGTRGERNTAACHK